MRKKCTYTVIRVDLDKAAILDTRSPVVNMSTISYETRASRYTQGTSADHRLLLYRFCKSRSRSCGVVSGTAINRIPRDNVRNGTPRDNTLQRARTPETHNVNVNVSVDSEHTGYGSDFQGRINNGSAGSRNASFRDSAVIVTDAGTQQGQHQGRLQYDQRSRSSYPRPEVKCDKTVDVNEVAFALRNMIGQQTTNGFARLDVVSECFCLISPYHSLKSLEQ